MSANDMSRYRRVRLTKPAYHTDGRLKAPAGALGYEVATGLLFGFSAVLFDDGQGVMLDGGGRPNQDVKALYLEDVKEDAE